MEEESDEPFPKAILAALEERDWSIRKLHRATQAERGWGSLATIQALVGGSLKPSFEAMEHIARVLRIQPEYFAEYRLAKRRRELDPQFVGLRKALRNLDHQ